MEQATDQALLERWVRDRDAEAFAEMVARHAGMVFATSRRILGNRTEAEEVAQDCFLKLATASAPAFPFLAEWLHKVAIHRSLDRLRQAKRRHAREERFARSQPTQTEPTWNEIEPYVDEAIAALPDKVRLLVVRHFLEGRSYSELAESLEIPRATLARRVQEGIAQVRRLLKGRGILVAAAGLGALLTRNAVEAAPETLVAKLGKVALAGTGGLVAEAAPVTLKTAMWGGALVGKKLLVAGIVVALGMGALYTYRAPILERLRKTGAAPQTDMAMEGSAASAQTPKPSDASKVRPHEARRAAATPSTKSGGDSVSTNTAMAALLEGLEKWRAGKKPGGAKELKPYTSEDIPPENGAHYFLLATELMPNADWDWVANMLDQVQANGWTDDPKILALFESCRASLDAIRTGIEMGNAMMPPVRSWNEPFPYLAQYRQLARVMDLEAQMYAAHGDYAAALDQYGAIMDFGAESARGAPVIGQLVGYSLCLAATDDLRTTLQSGGASPAEYRDIANHIMALQDRQYPMAESVAMEADATSALLNDSADIADFQTFLANPETGLDEAARNTFASASPEQFLAMLNDAEQSYRTFAAYTALPYYEFRTMDLSPLERLNPMISSLENVPAQEARADAQLYGTALTAALEAYRGENGAYPASLDALAPGYVNEVPKDPFTGAPFHYATTDSGFRLYSAGPDMRDDNGLAGDKWNSEGSDLIIHN